MDSLDLPLVWAAILALAVLLYVVMDGFVLGVGILFPFAESDEHRDLMMTAVAPVWDGNQTWLVLGGAGLFAAFPPAFAVLMPALYMPIGFMVTALIFRGVAFEFRWRATGAGRRLWDQAFHWGSVAATFAQGLILGTMVQGIPVQERGFAGDPFDWLTPFSFTVGCALVWGYALLGAAWLIVKTEGELLDWCRRAARPAALVVLGTMVVVAIWVPAQDMPAARQWGLRDPFLDWERLALLAPIPALALLSFAGLFRALGRDSTYGPYLWTVALYVLGFAGLVAGIWPYLVPYSLSFRDAAAAPGAQGFLLAGTLVLLPLTLSYTAYVYWTHRGKVTRSGGYH